MMNIDAIMKLRQDIIRSAVSRIKRFGFIHVNETNIFHDEVYKRFFARILLEKIGESPEFDALLKQLILEIE